MAPKALMPVISDPRTDSREVSRVTEDSDSVTLEKGFATKASENKCFNCKKTGHWARDCPEEGTLFRNDLSTKFVRFKDKYRSFRSKAPIRNKRVHFITQDDEDSAKEDQQSPSDRLEEDTIDRELEELFAGIDDA
ncbi:hypothetical protein GGR58DRAFT_509188 [Xylaria digitata]|nr:hypothetical protein GGR58DRAFT_509188 [Xylaria digitata]